MRYQETWINGPTDEPHQRPCADRYEIIRKVAERYSRPFSVFDLGCNSGYFGFRLAQEFENCTVVMVDNKPWLKDLIRKNKAGKIVWVNAHPSAHDLYHLSMCESFDIVLGLAVLHHMDEPMLAMNALENLSDHVFIETPGEGDTGSRNYESHCLPLLKFFDNYCAQPDGLKKIAEVPSHVTDVMRPIYYKTNLPFIRKQRLDADFSGASLTGNYDIEADYARKIITIYRKLEDKTNDRYVRTREMRHFVPGINLHNFKLMGGGWPEVGTEMEVMGDMSLCDDNQKWNFILDGQSLHAIDLGTKIKCTFPRDAILSYRDNPFEEAA